MDPIVEPVVEPVVDESVEPEEFTHRGQVYECFVKDGALDIVHKESQLLVIRKPLYDSEIEYVTCHPDHLLLGGPWAYTHYITYNKLFAGGDFYHCVDYDHVYFDGETVRVGYRDCYGTTTYPRDVFFADPDSILKRCRHAYISPMWKTSRGLESVLFDQLCRQTPYEGVVYEGAVVTEFGDLVDSTVVGLESGQDYTEEYNPSTHLIAMLREPVPQPVREGCFKREGFEEVTVFQKILFFMITGASWDEFCCVGAQMNPTGAVNLLFTFVFSNKTVLITIKSHLVLGENDKFGKHYYMDRSIPVHIKIH